MEEQYQLIVERLRRLYEELLEAEKQLHPALTRIRRALGEFLGIKEPVVEPVVEKKEEVPTLIIPEARPVITPVTPLVTPAPRRTLVEELLSEILKEIRTGVKPKTYTDHKFVVAKEPITYEGNVHDLGGTYDALILVPSIDCQIEIDKPVEPSTPIILARTALNLDNIRVSKIYYKGITPGLVGTMSIWAFRY